MKTQHRSFIISTELVTKINYTALHFTLMQILILIQKTVDQTKSCLDQFVPSHQLYPFLFIKKRGVVRHYRGSVKKM